MTRHRLIVRSSVTALTAAALAASTAAAMPARDAGRHSGETRTHHNVLPASRVDAAAHAATIRGIGARLLADSTCN
jgi:hypothetical protein